MGLITFCVVITFCVDVNAKCNNAKCIKWGSLHFASLLHFALLHSYLKLVHGASNVKKLLSTVNSKLIFKYGKVTKDIYKTYQGFWSPSVTNETYHYHYDDDDDSWYGNGDNGVFCMLDSTLLPDEENMPIKRLNPLQSTGKTSIYMYLL
jgi:hypothetical protein